MTPAERLARLPGCWRPGMRDVGDHNVPYSRIVDVWPNGYPRRWTNEGEDGDRYTASLEEAEGLWRGCVPDLTDPATVGCLAAWCREVYGLRDLYCRPLLPGGWLVSRLSPMPFVAVIENTEGDAWVAAILAKLEPK